MTDGVVVGECRAPKAGAHALLDRAGWNVEENGLFGAPPISVIVGEEVHATMLKSLSLLEYGRSRAHVVPSDAQRRMGSRSNNVGAGCSCHSTQAGDVSPRASPNPPKMSAQGQPR
jgi:hypothetical protein